MTIPEAKELKDQARELLITYVQENEALLSQIDSRLLSYYNHLTQHSSTIEDDENDLHCCMELLCALKVLRLMQQYDVDVEGVQRVIRLREGDWHKDGMLWVHDGGGMRLPGTGNTMSYYRWEPFQIFIWASIYGLRAWIDTETPCGSRSLLPTERDSLNTVTS